VKKILRNLRSALAIGIVSLFVLFLTVSAPHRVHHLFENLREPNHHGHHVHAAIRSHAASAVHEHARAHSAGPFHTLATYADQNHDDTPQMVCLLEGAAKHSHLSTVQLIKVAFFGIESEERPQDSILVLSLFNSSPFSQRAPPCSLVPQQPTEAAAV
jgi:hypothetical protein